MIDITKIRDKKLLIATPMGRAPVMEYLASHMRTVVELERARIPYVYSVICDQSDLAYARNALAARFLASDCTDLLWIDSDMGWEPESVFRVLASDKDVVGAAASRRCRSGDPTQVDLTVHFLDDAAYDADGLLPIRSIGFGFTKVARSVFTRIIAAHPELKRPPNFGAAHVDKLEMWRFHQFDGLGTGEDYAFFQMWRDLGGDIWLDPEINLSHIGDYNYFADVSKALGRKAEPA